MLAVVVLVGVSAGFAITDAMVADDPPPRLAQTSADTNPPPSAGPTSTPSATTAQTQAESAPSLCQAHGTTAALPNPAFIGGLSVDKDALLKVKQIGDAEENEIWGDASTVVDRVVNAGRARGAFIFPNGVLPAGLPRHVSDTVIILQPRGTTGTQFPPSAQGPFIVVPVDRGSLLKGNEIAVAFVIAQGSGVCRKA